MVITNQQQLVGANMESHQPGIKYSKPTQPNLKMVSYLWARLIK